MLERVTCLSLMHFIYCYCLFQLQNYHLFLLYLLLVARQGWSSIFYGWMTLDLLLTEHTNSVNEPSIHPQSGWFLMTEVRKPGGSGSGHTKMHHCSFCVCFFWLAEHPTNFIVLLDFFFMQIFCYDLSHTPVDHVSCDFANDLRVNHEWHLPCIKSSASLKNQSSGLQKKSIVLLFMQILLPEQTYIVSIIGIWSWTDILKEKSISCNGKFYKNL